MTCRDFTRKLLLCCLVTACTFVPASAEETIEMVDSSLLQSVTDAEVEMESSEEDPLSSEAVHMQSSIMAGYRFFSVHRNGGRAAEFEYLRSNPVFAVSHHRLGNSLKYSLDGSYLNDKDYSGEVLFDYLGEYRFLLRTESLFHNLDRQLLLFEPFDAPAAFLPDYQGIQDDFQREYGIRVEQDTASFRYKIHDFPFHINFGYWRLLQQGSRQLIFSDQDFLGGPNRIYARPRTIDRQTHEGSFSADAHLGAIDLLYLFKIRQFVDHAGIPADNYVGRPDLLNNPISVGGLQQHNEDPNSRFISHTVKLHTSLAGGIVAGGSYSYGIRDNRSRLSDVSGADRRATVLHNAANDFVYTPCKEFSLSLKYRLHHIDNESPAVILSQFSVPQQTAVRPSLDILRNAITATMSVRPLNNLSLIGEYEGAFVRRRDVFNDGPASLQWLGIQEQTDTHRGTFTIISRPAKGMRLKAIYSYSTADAPAYGSSFEEKHEEKFLATYNSVNRWGLTVGYHGIQEKNDRVFHQVLGAEMELVPYPSPVSRERFLNQVSSSIWFNPFDRLTLSGSYSLMHNSIDQSVLFTAVSPVSGATNYTSQSHVYSVGSAYHLNERLDLSVLFQQIRSFSEFDPVLIAPDEFQSTAGLKEISRTRTVENSISARSDFKVSANVSCIFDYSFREYSDKVVTQFNGDVQSFMVYLNAKW